ncbi:hypothetical protein Q9292_10035 [Methylophilus sp. VKM B-3414]|uniref:hypothetical protein n=1 Tax=Methylophilus sp. VKM B-3414 TaxID=3076121 RepID=UPI0028C9A3B5|nr:hypothetical protein [Methylophilus sp. VKM B-3414]MDT7849950.1 hypothetical protein [Methylophilus sp. VKM B-3414]
MKNPFATIAAMRAIAGLSSLAGALTKYTESPSRSRGVVKQKNTYSYPFRRSNSKYSRPHQGAQEIARRKHQIERGILQVSKP